MAQQTDSFEFKDENARFGIRDEWVNKPLHIGGQKQQTAISWLQDKLNNVKPTQFCSIETIKEWVEQAKAMEKEQIIKTYNNAISKMDYFIQPESAEQYYNETYNKQL